MISKHRIPINRLEHRIRIRSDDEVIHECWASVKQMSGYEIAKNNVQFEQATTSFVIRYTQTTITSDMTIEFDGYVYDIQYTNDYNFSHEYIEIIAIKRSWSVAQ